MDQALTWTLPLLPPWGQLLGGRGQWTGRRASSLGEQGTAGAKGAAGGRAVETHLPDLPAATKLVSHLIEKLPGSVGEKSPPADVLINIIAVLNNLVVASPVAARDLLYFDGLRKLVFIKKKRDRSGPKPCAHPAPWLPLPSGHACHPADPCPPPPSPDSEKSSRAASSLLANLWQYNKLHRDFRAVCSRGPGQAGLQVWGTEAGQEGGTGKPRCTGGLDGQGLLPAHWTRGSTALTVGPLSTAEGLPEGGLPGAVGEAFLKKESAM